MALSKIRQHGKNSTFSLNSLGLSRDHLWLGGILICFFFVISPMPIAPNDFWWHLKIGEIIYQTGSVPTTAIFSWTLGADYPFTYGAWLAEYLFYIFYRVGGVELLIFLRNLLTVLAYTLVGIEAYRRSHSWRIAGLVTLLACAMASNNVEVRPQLWAWFPFMAFYMLLSRYVDRQLNPRWLLALPFAMAFWVNAHGTFVLGPILLGIFFVGELVKILLKMTPRLGWPEMKWLFGAGVLTALGMLVNPRFIGIIGYVYNMMTNQPSQRLVVEWQSPNPDSYATIFFFISILILLAVFAYSRYRLTPTEALLVAAFLWLGWSGLRYVVWYAMVVMPILAAILYDMVKDKTWMAVPQKHFLNLVFLIVIAIPVVFVQPWSIARLPMTPGYWTAVLRSTEPGPMLTVNTPVAAAEYLKQNPGGKLFNEMGYGSYLIWAVPEQGVFADPRVELYPYSYWLDYIKISDGVRYNQLLDKYGVDRLLLHRKDQAELIFQLEGDTSWVKEYEDPYAQVWKKASAP